jgi:hypothetical protein
MEAHPKRYFRAKSDMTSRAPQRSLPAPTIREESLKMTVEDRFIMKNFILITALAMLTGTIVLIPLNAQAQSTPAQNTAPQNAQVPDPKETEFVTNWYDVCITKKPIDTEKCYQLSKELTEKYPNANKDYITYAKRRIEEYTLGKAIEKFNIAVKAYYATSPDSNRLEALFTAGDEYLELDKDPQSPVHLYIVAQQAMAGQGAVLAGAYKNPDKVKTYAEKALKSFETLNPPEKYKKEYTDYNLFNLRDLVLANMNQYLGYYLIETKGDQPEAQVQALAYINRSIQVRGKDSRESIGWKDPNNYSLRRTLYAKQYTELRKKYDALTDEQKTGDMGKELLKQVNELLDKKMIPELARLIATATRPELSEVKNDATQEFDGFWKFRVDDPSKAPAYLKSFDADPTVEGPPVPAKAEESSSAAAPTINSGTTKLSAGTAAVPGTSTGKATNGTKTSGKTSTKSKTAPKKKSSRKR